MPHYKRIKTKYPGVYCLFSKGEKTYYIVYRKYGRKIEEKAGHQYKDNMTPAKAAQIRLRRIRHQELTNKEQREELAGIYTINRLWSEYKEHNPHVRGLRIDSYRYRSHIAPTCGDKIPSLLVPLDIERLRVELSKTLKPSTVKSVLSLLRRIINFGVRMQLVDPLTFKIKIPKVDDRKTEDLTPQELQRLVEVLNAELPFNRTARLMKLALLTGMRRGELFNLKWDDIDFDKGWIYIRGPKGGVAVDIPLPEGAREILEHCTHDSEYVFPGRKGKLNSCCKSANRLKRLAGLPVNFRPFHGLRHVYASILASSGQVDMYVIQKLLGHKSASMTARYSHLRDMKLREASKIIEKNILIPLSS